MTGSAGDRESIKVPALQVKQWLPAWDSMSYGGPHQKKPKDRFYMFSMSASMLKRLSGIQRRETTDGLRRADDLGIQRRHDPDRSNEINEFVENGFPWSSLNERRKSSGEFDDLKKPGWLPTAIVVNILEQEDARGEERVSPEDLVAVSDENGGVARVSIPEGAARHQWKPSGLHPIEVIDGQHRLWAFGPGEHEDFELPVVAFHGLDLSWQAYLFWTINIKPKRINASLAFDLYPLLRTEDWLERFEGPSVYRETRAQELTELLWAHPMSAWYHRINMLGESGKRGVSQAAWVRSLTNSFIKSFEGKGVTVGGMFGAPVGRDELALPWTREQQAAFLIEAWSRLANAVHDCQAEWAESARRDQIVASSEDGGDAARIELDPAFSGRFSLLNTDQGVRAYLQVVNDVCVHLADELALRTWPTEKVDGESDLDDVTAAIEDLRGQPVAEAIGALAESLASFDWRTSSHPDLSEDERTLKAGFRGSGGYRELRRQLLRHLAGGAPQPVRDAAAELRDILKLS